MARSGYENVASTTSRSERRAALSKTAAMGSRGGAESDGGN